jgi:two-component system cell cycle response regulator DivK
VDTTEYYKKQQIARHCVSYDRLNIEGFRDPNGSGKKKVMIVEDNDLNLKLFHDLLVAHGYEVIFTQKGEEAYEMACREKPDLILMDIQLQGISGLDVIAQMKRDPAIMEVPIIAVTAFAMREDEERILRSGCEAYVSKPISIMPFLDTIRKFASLH